MNRHLALGSILGSSATAVLLTTQPASAQTAITGIQVNPTDTGAVVVLETDNGDRPQIFTVRRGNTLVADVVNAQLSLPDGNGFLQNDPAPGISAITVSQLDANSVRVIVDGEDMAPEGRIEQSNGDILFSFSVGGEVAEAPAETPSETLPEIEDDEEVEEVPVTQLPSEEPAQPPVVQERPADVMVPNPQVRIDGVQVEPSAGEPAPPFLPRAIAPPVGDIAISNIDPSPSRIDLGTSERVPRLVLRDAPVREVLALLARAAGLNLAYIGADAESTEEEVPEVRVSLEIEDEPVEDVFNYVLRISGVQASRFGRTIFAGPRLPNSARQLVVRNLRLNQVDVPTALNFLVGLGAETAVSRERLVTFVNAVEVGEGAPALTQTESVTEDRVETQRIDYEDSNPILRGLQVVGDERTNSVTLVGPPRLVEMAIAQLVPLDIRRRQVAVSVRIIDIDLSALERQGSSFSFGIDDTRVLVENGIGVLNFGDDAPFNTTLTGDTFGDVVDNFPGLEVSGDNDAFSFARNFLAQLQFAVQSGNAKILTDPTLVVQEGQAAEVVLAENVITNIEIETTITGGVQEQTVTVETEPAGVVFRVQIDRIDDNGFVSLSVAPTVSSPGAVETVEVEGASIDLTLLEERRVTSGQLRLRDGQTLVIAGIIQEQDTTTVSKVPILGDIPLLGALFRRTDRDNSRSEVIALLSVDILDDSENSTFGYRYPLSPESQELLNRNR
ncbi:MAG: AMIN domain-containing protein [Elainellaceae cyanobacterium]